MSARIELHEYIRIRVTCRRHMSNDAECSRCGLHGGVQSRGRVTRRGRAGRGGLNCSKERVGADDGLSASAVQLSLEQDIGVINDIGLDGATVGSTRRVVLCLNELPRRVPIRTGSWQMSYFTCQTKCAWNARSEERAYAGRTDACSCCQLHPSAGETIQAAARSGLQQYPYQWRRA
jgi:hypothetical protein